MKKCLILLAICGWTSFSVPAQSRFNQFNRGLLYRSGDLSANDTKGDPIYSPYLFNDWVNSSFVNKYDSTVNDPRLVFNYDKLSGNLLISDKKEVIEVSPNQIHSFTLLGPDGKTVHYQKVELINDSLLFELVFEGNIYALFKFNRTEFLEANYYGDGMVETGRKYNEYQTRSEFFLAKRRTNEYLRFELNEKSFRAACGDCADRASAYFSRHTDETLNEVYFAKLIMYLNEE